MQKKKIVFESLKIDPLIAFKGTDAEIETAERKKAERREEIEKLLNDEKFISLSFQKWAGLWEAVTPSTRPGEKLQKTCFFRSDPTSHQSTTDPESEKELIREIARQSYFKNLNITLFTA